MLVFLRSKDNDNLQVVNCGWGWQRHSPSKTSCSKILMMVYYCGHHLARWLGWAETAYFKNGGATFLPRACRYSLQQEAILYFGVQVGTCNGGTLKKMGEVCERLIVDNVCCLQQVRLREQSFMI